MSEARWVEESSKSGSAGDNAGSAVAEKNPGRKRPFDWAAWLAVAVGVFYACATLALRQETPTTAYAVGDAKGGGTRQEAIWAQKTFDQLPSDTAVWLRAHPQASAQCASPGAQPRKQKPAWALWDGEHAYPWIGHKSCPLSPEGQASRWRLAWDAKAGAPALWGDVKLSAYEAGSSQAAWANSLAAALDEGFGQLQGEEAARRAREGWQARFAQKSAASAQRRLQQEQLLSDPALATGEFSSSGASLSALMDASRPPASAPAAPNAGDSGEAASEDARH